MKVFITALIFFASLSIDRCCPLYSEENASNPLKVNQILIKGDLSRYARVNKDGVRVIHLSDGIYIMTTTVRLSSNTILEGEGPKTTLKAASDFHGQQFITNSDSISGNKNISLRSFKVQFEIDTVSGDAPGVLRFSNIDGLSISDVVMALNTKMYGIDLSAYVRNASVQGCTIANGGHGGDIMVRNGDKTGSHSTDGIRILHNHLSSCDDEPIAVFGWLGIVSDVLVDANTVEAKGASFGITAYGIDKQGETGKLERAKITGNVVNGGRVGAIAVKCGAESIEVEDNLIKDTANDGIFIDPGGNFLPPPNHLTISGNSIENAGRHGMYVIGKDISLKENRIKHCREVGIYVHEVQGGKIHVLDNCIENAERSILVDGPFSGVILNNTINNTIQKEGDILYLK